MAREDTDIKLRNILRLGACQLLLEDRIPESAAVNTAVQLCTETGMEGLKGVCNGILRNLIRKKEELVFPDPEEEPDLAASVRCSLPVWLWKLLKEHYGAEDAEKIATFRSASEGWTLRPNLTRVQDEEFEKILEKKVWEKEKTDLPHAWKIRGAMNIARDADFLNGSFSIMTPGSMMACLAMDPRRGKQILDCCAAPGGKTCYMAELMGGTGRVQAWDIHEHRTALIEAQARRLGLENIRPMVRDAGKKREDLYRSMDGVLLDAPCTGLGMLAEKPDIKLRITEESLKELTGIQQKLLDTVCEYVKPGGTLVYSTCSVLPEENEMQVERFLSDHPEFEVCELPETIPQRYREHRKKGLQLLEFRDGVEGFYLCRMKRKE
jgi:16S rRNA (cytosine967-C5)-methyltransferase